MRKINVHVLYEYGVDMRPHGSGQLRLLRPLSYPPVRERVEATFGRDLHHAKPDLVLLDRLWCPDNTPQKVCDLAHEVHQRGAKLIYWFDDNFQEIGIGEKSIREARKASMQQMLFQTCLEVSDGFVVTTKHLEDTFQHLGKPIRVISNNLDERLIVRKLPAAKHSLKIIIGYMGTATHDDDLRMILPAFQHLNQKYPGKLQFQFIGILDDQKLRYFNELKQLPFERVRPLPVEIEYPLFMVWFTGSVHWDIAVAPLQDNQFTQCKSDIKLLDYAVANIPAVVSNVPAYSTVQHGETALRVNNSVDEWIAAIEELIHSEPLRMKLARNATNYQFSERILGKQYGQWVEVLSEFAQGKMTV